MFRLHDAPNQQNLVNPKRARTLRTSTELVGSARLKGAANWPGERTRILVPNMMGASDLSESVQKGRKKSWLSMCGGMQSPSL